MIVIVAPYGRNEVTAAAIRLADVAVEAGLDVRLLAAGVHEGCVHPFWDSRVLSARTVRGVRQAAVNAAHCVWFSCLPELMDMVKIVAGTASHTLVPSWHTLRPPDIPVILQYDGIICPTKQCHAAIKEHVFAGSLPAGKVISWARWDAGLSFTRRAGQLDSSCRRVMFHCDSASIDECSLVVLNTVDQLLVHHADMVVTVLCAKTWCRRDRVRIRQLEKCHGRRLAFVYQRGWTDQVELFQQHDWLVLPGVHSDFGLTAMRGLACGLPVVCYDVSPFSEQVVDGYNGALVQCELSTNWLHAPVAAASSVNLLERCCEVLADHDTLGAIQHNDWHLSRCRSVFTRFWLSLWGL